MDGETAAGTLMDVGLAGGTDAPAGSPVADKLPVAENHKRPWSEAHVIFLIHEALAGRPYERIAECVGRHGEGVRNKLHHLLTGAENCPEAAADDLIALRKRLATPAATPSGEAKAGAEQLVEQYRRLANVGAQLLARANVILARVDLALAAIAVVAGRVCPDELNPVGRMLLGHIEDGHLCRLVATVNAVRDCVPHHGREPVYESTEPVAAGTPEIAP